MRLHRQRTQRTAAWLLLPLMLLQFLSGYAMIHWRLFDGFLNRVSAFVIHGVPWIRRALAKQRIAELWLDGSLAAGAGLAALGSYLTIQG